MSLRIGVFLSDHTLARHLARDETLAITTPPALPDCLNPAALDAVVVEATRLSLLRVAREREMPCIALSMWGNELEDAYDAGCDMFVVAPWSADEIAARVRALMRRRATLEVVPAAPVRYLSLALIPGRRALTVGTTEVRVSQPERVILEHLITAEGGIVERQRLARLFHHRADPVNSLNGVVCVLRKRLAAAGADVAIENHPGHGYRLVEVA